MTDRGRCGRVKMLGLEKIMVAQLSRPKNCQPIFFVFTCFCFNCLSTKHFPMLLWENSLSVAIHTQLKSATSIPHNNKNSQLCCLWKLWICAKNLQKMDHRKIPISILGPPIRLLNRCDTYWLSINLDEIWICCLLQLYLNPLGRFSWFTTLCLIDV